MQLKKNCLQHRAVNRAILTRPEIAQNYSLKGAGSQTERQKTGFQGYFAPNLSVFTQAKPIREMVTQSSLQAWPTERARGFFHTTSCQKRRSDCRRADGPFPLTAASASEGL